MNEILKLELEKYFKRISGRARFIESQLNKYDLNKGRIGEFEEYINNKLHLIVKELLIKQNFDFKKGRNIHKARIMLENDKILIRNFKRRYSFEIDYLNENSINSIGMILPKGFWIAVNSVQNILDKIGKIDEVCFKKDINCNIPIEYIRDNSSIIKDIIEKVSMDNETIIDLKEDGWGISKQSYYNDKVFEIILNLLRQHKEVYDKKQEQYEQVKKEIDDFFQTEFNKIMVVSKIENE